jgi:hypothetical protein
MLSRRSRHSHHAVKHDGSDDQQRLPTPSHSREPLPRHAFFDAPDPQRPFAGADLPAMARPVSPTAAATAMASSGQAPLDVFCNQERARAHRRGTRTPPGPRWPAIRCEAGQIPSSRRAVRARDRGHGGALRGAAHTDRATREPACTQRCRGQLTDPRAPPSSPSPRFTGLEHRIRAETVKAVVRIVPRERRRS